MVCHPRHELLMRELASLFNGQSAEIVACKRQIIVVSKGNAPVPFVGSDLDEHGGISKLGEGWMFGYRPGQINVGREAIGKRQGKLTRSGHRNPIRRNRARDPALRLRGEE